MYCKKCGSLLNDGASFCPNCGQTISVKASVPAAGSYVPPQQTGYGAYPGGIPQSGYGYYGNQQYGKTNSSGTSIKGPFMLVMAVLLIILSVGLVEFPVVKQGKDWFYSIGANNGDTFILELDRADGNIFEVFGNLIDDGELAGVCTVVSLIVMCISILIAVVGILCSLVKNYAAAALSVGIGLLLAAVGYLAVTIEGIYIVSNGNDFIKTFISAVPPVMLIVCIGLAVVAFVSAGRMKNSD